MPLSPTPQLKLKLAEAIKEFKSTIDSGFGVTEDNFKFIGQQRLKEAGDKFGNDVGQALDDWLEAVTLVIAPGQVTAGSPTSQVTTTPFSNIEKI